MQRKSFTAPFWLLVPIVGLHLLSIFIGMAVRNPMAERDVAAEHREILLIAIHGALILTECLLYFRFRYWITRRAVALCHVFGLLIAWIAVPVIFTLIGPDPAKASTQTEIAEFNRRMAMMNTLENGLTLALQLLAHGLFVWLMIDTIRKKKAALLKAQQTAATGPDILHDYAEQ